MSLDSRKIQRFHAMLDKCKLKEQKRNILNGQGVESTKDLSEMQLDGLIAWLNSMLQWSEFKDHQFATFDMSNKSHMYLLSLCQEYGWTVWNEKMQREVSDLNKLGAWIRKCSAVKKPLLQQDNADVRKTIYQFAQMVKKHFDNN
jgi:hypothetical protein